MRKLTLTTLLLAIFSSFSLFSFSQNSLLLKKSVAVTDFKDVTSGANGAGAQGGSQTDPNAQSGGGAPGQAGQSGDPNAQPAGANGAHADYSSMLVTMLTTELVKTNAFIVSEGLQPSDNVQFLVTGSITKWEGTPKGKDFTSYHSHNTSTVTVELRIIDASSGQIISAQTATSTVSQKNIFNNKVDHTLDSAQHKVVAECVDFIKAASAKVAWEGSVVKAGSDGTVFIKPGSNGGVMPGMIFSVFEIGEELKDGSGQSLGHDMKKVGTITVTGDIGNGKAAKATLTSGKGLKAGDVLKPE
jgi:Curli production assembly/transport component CsgG